MLLSSNVISNGRVIDKNKEHVIPIVSPEDYERYQALRDEKDKTDLESYNVIGGSIVKKARDEAAAVKNAAMEESRELYKKAHDEGFEKGIEEGKKKGYEDAYNDTVVKEKVEVENFKSLAQQNVSNMIKSAEFEVKQYMKDKEEEIKKLSIEIAQHILKERVKESDGLNSMVYDALDIVKKNKSIIIKCSKNHSDSIRQSLENWKSTLPYRGDFFVIDDEYTDEGSAIIESDSGKVKVSIDDALKNIKKVIFKTE